MSSTPALLILEEPLQFFPWELCIEQRKAVNGPPVPDRARRARATVRRVADQDDLDYVGIWRLHAAYADAVSRRSWGDLESLFLPDAPIRVDTVTGDPIEAVGAAGIGRFIAGAVERFEFFELVILNVHVLPGGGSSDERRSRAFTCELRQDGSTGHWPNAS